jgi:transposase
MYNFLRNCDTIYTANEAKVRLFVTAVLWITRSGAQWRLLPEKYGAWNSVYRRFNEWTKKGIWEQMFRHCSEDHDLEYIMIDASVMRAHACAAGAKKGAIRLLVEARGDTPPSSMQR